MAKKIEKRILIPYRHELKFQLETFYQRGTDS